jgi:hypothetical protein
VLAYLPYPDGGAATFWTSGCLPLINMNVYGSSSAADVKVGRFHPFYRPRRPLGRVDLGTRRGEGSALRPGRFPPPGKTRYPLYRRLGWPQGRS